MQTEEFAEQIKTLIEMAQNDGLVLMCAEALPWRCHRSLIADALSVRGIEVIHIISATSQRTHSLTFFAKVRGKKITYPAG